MYCGRDPKSKALMQAHGKELCQFTLGCLPPPCDACQGPSEVQGNLTGKSQCMYRIPHLVYFFNLSNAVIYRRHNWYKTYKNGIKHLLSAIWCWLADVLI